MQVTVVDFIRDHQLNIMLFLSGICAILTILTLLTKTLTPRMRWTMASLELSAMLLLLFDRAAYLYRGDPSVTGYWMVRISNFMVYFLTLCVMHAITRYLGDLCRSKGPTATLPKRLLVCEALFAAGILLLVIAQFTGLY